MKHIQAKASDIKKFVAALYEDGKTPSERAGMPWDSLSTLERKVPELTCKTLAHKQKLA